jgi:hypothetical protein
MNDKSSNPEHPGLPFFVSFLHYSEPHAARQVLYCLSHSTSPFCVFLFVSFISAFFLIWFFLFIYLFLHVCICVGYF